MSDGDRLLLFSAIPYPDESFVGYLLRLTERNHYDTLSWILQLAKIRDFVRAGFTFARQKSIDLKPLAELTGVDKTVLRSMLYRPIQVSKERMMGQYSVFGSALPHYLIRLTQPKICPDCIRESSYARKIWELAPVTACPFHCILLLDECPSCRERIAWNRARISLCRCGFDWRGHQAATVDSSELVVTQQIYRLCNLPAGPYTTDKSRSNNPLYVLGLRQFIYALIFIASQFEGIAHKKWQRIIDTKGKTFAPSRRNAEIHALLCKALQVFDDWPYKYYSFLDWRREQKDTSSYARADNNYFREYKSVLFVQLASADFEFIRLAFREYRYTRRYESYVQGTGYLDDINARKEKEDELSFSTRATLVPTPAQTEAKIWKLHETHVSGKKAVKALNITWRGLYGLIASERLKAIIGIKEGQKAFLVEKASLEELKEKLKRAVYLQDVKRLLGIQRVRVEELIECGLLTPIRGPKVDGFGVWIFDIKDVEDLVIRLLKRLPKRQRVDKQKVLSLKFVISKIARVGINLGTFFQDVLTGDIRPCGRGKDPGFHGLLFREKQIADYIQHERQLSIGNALSISEAANLFGVRRSAIGFLIRKGFLQAEKSAKAQALSLLIKEEDLESFTETYVWTRDIASEYGTSPLYIIDLLAKQGVKPVSGPKIDDGWIYIMKKRDVERLDLATLISEKKRR